MMAAILLPLVLAQYGNYKSQRGASFAIELTRVWAGIVIVFSTLIVASAISKTTEHVSRLWSGLWLLYVFLALTTLRLAVREFLRRLRFLGYDSKRIILVVHGDGEQVRHIIRQVICSASTGYRLVGYMSEVPLVSPEFLILQYLGPPGDVGDLALKDRLPADQIWVVISEGKPELFAAALDLASRVPQEVRLVPDGVLAAICEYNVTSSAGVPTIELAKSPMTGLNRVLKALVDRVFAALFLILTIPLFCVIALAIRLDSPGPVFFRQNRHGWNAETIVVLKFRTMSQHQESDGGLTQARRNDPRVTRVGKLLRRTSLDELPQFINVLQGNMSLVGPRPHAMQHNEAYNKIVQNYMQRHRVKPGITGWAQVNGFRGETDTIEKMQQRVEYDLYYIENWSVGFDVLILLLTAVRTLGSPSAY
jgi:putative colanic acid biosynthesis UDP-glucose lipid carrier transferase